MLSQHRRTSLNWACTLRPVLFVHSVLYGVHQRVLKYYRRPGFLAVVDLSPLHSPPPTPVNKLSLFTGLLVCRSSNLLTGGGRTVPNHPTARSLVLYKPLTDFCASLPVTEDGWGGVCAGAQVGRIRGCFRRLRAPGIRITVTFSFCSKKTPTTERERARFTDKKENQIFLIYKEIQSGTVAKSYIYMTNGLLIHGEIFAHFLIY